MSTVAVRYADVAGVDLITDNEPEWLEALGGESAEETLARHGWSIAPGEQWGGSESPNVEPGAEVVEVRRGRGRPAVGPTFSVRFPADLLARVDAAAKSSGQSRAEWLRWAAERAL